MAEHKTITLAQVRIEGAGDYVSLMAFQIDTKENAHGVMTVTLCLNGDNPENQSKDWTGEQIQAISSDGNVLFNGECIDCYKNIMSKYCEVTLYVVSQSYQADITYNSRTFQDCAKTFQAVVTKVLEPYGALVQIEKDTTVSSLLVQKEETDWAFLIRIANAYEYNVYTDVSSERLKVSFGSPVRYLEDYFSSPQIISETKNPQEKRLKFANQGENAGLYHYSSEDIYSYNPYATAGVDVDGKLVTSSKVCAERGVLVNYASTALMQDAIPENESMMSEITKSNILSGEVLAVNQSTIKVKFDVDGSQGEAEAKELPYENTLSNSFYCMPEIGDKVYGYIDNRGIAVILGSKRKAVVDDFFDKPEEKSITILDNMILFATNTLTLSANREDAEQNEDKRISIIMDKESGIDIHSYGSINIYSDKKIGILAGNDIPNLEEVYDNFNVAEKNGREKYIAAQGAELVKASWGSEFWGQLSDSYVNFFNSITFAEARKDISHFFAPDEKEAVSESYEEGTLYMGAEQICLMVGDSYIVLGSPETEYVSMIYINSELFRWLGFERRSDYEVVADQYTDGWDTFLDIAGLVWDIAAMVVFCVCPIAGAIMMGVSALVTLARGDYCGALLACIPFAGKVGVGAKLINKFSKLEKAVKIFAKVCNTFDNVQGVLQLGNQAYCTIKSFVTHNFTVADLGKLGLMALSMFVGKKTDKYIDANNVSIWDDPWGRLTPDTPSSAQGGNGSGGSSGADNPPSINQPSTPDVNQTSPEIDANTTSTVTEGADPVDMVTGALTERHTDFLMKDIKGDYAVIRTYRSNRENKGRMLGSRWMFQFEVSLHREEEYISIYLPDAHKEQFHLTDSGWKNLIQGREKYRLTELTDGYELEDVDTSTCYCFDCAGHLLCIYDEYRNSTRYTYVGNLITKITIASGLELNLTYVGDKLTMIKDSQGREYHYQYEGDLLIAVTYPNGGTLRYEYTKEGFLIRIFNENGKCYVTNQYDRKGRVIHQDTADGEEYIFFYNDARKENTLTTVSLNRTVTYCYNRSNLVEKIIYNDGTSEEKRYDANEKILWEKDRLGRETIHEYDSQGRRLKTVLPNGLCTEYAYNEQGKCISQQDNSGRHMKFVYDEQGGLGSASFMVEPGVFLMTSYERDRNGRIIAQTYADGSKKSWEYETYFAHPTHYYGAEGESYSYELDDYGRKMIFHGARGDVYYGYNTNHFLTMIRDEENNCTRYQYDLTGNKIGVLMPEDVEAEDGRQITYTYDLMDHLTGIENACGRGYIREVNSEGKSLKLQGKGENAFATEYSYDEDGRKTHVRYPDGGVQRSYYDACGNLIKQVSPEDYNEETDSGKGITFAYDEMNRLTAVWDRDGNQIRAITYDLAGRIIRDSNAKDLSLNSGDIGTLYRYNLAGWLLEERVPVKEEQGEIYYRLTTYGYDKRGHRTVEKRYLDYQSAYSAAGRVLRIQREFDKSGRLIKITDSQGSCLEYTYDTHNKVTSEKRKIRNGVYQKKEYAYTKSGNLESVKQSADIKGCGRAMVKTAFRYNRNGKVTAVLTPTGNEIHRVYDRSNRMLREEYIQKDGKLHSIVEYSYDNEGRIAHIKQNGKEYEYGYDCRGRRNLIIENTGNAKAWLYDKNSRLIKEIGATEYKRHGFKGRGKSFLYRDDRLQAIYRMDGGLENAYSYNTFGEITQQQDGNGATLAIMYDHRGRRVHASTGSGAAQEWSYDPWGNVEYVTDGNGNRTAFTYDGWGKVTGVERADGGIETYSYDAAGNLTETMDGNGGVLHFLYNSQNCLEERIDQSGRSEYWNYDADGRCCLHRDRDGREIAYTYNMLGSLTSRRSLGEIACSEIYSYTVEGYLSSAISGGMRYDYTYDNCGRLRDKKASGRILLSYEYDANGRVSARKDLTGKETAYQYNEYDQLASVMDNGIEVACYDYTPDGRIAGVTTGELRSTYMYDAEGSLQQLTTMYGDELLVSNSYRYDFNGNCVYKKTLSGVTEYSYDCMNRLEQVIYPNTAEKYSYDYADNRISMELFETLDSELKPSRKVQYEYDECNRLIRSSDHNVNIPDAEAILSEYIYDNQGNLLNDQETEYTYDAFNRMEKAEGKDGQIQVNRYDAEGLRHEMEENGKLVQFLYSGREVVAETEADGNIIRYIRGYSLICSDNEKAKTYYHYASDELGSITHVVKNKDISNRYEYDAFGNTTVCEEQVSNRFRFTGQQYDRVTGQYYLRARFYNPVIGRFIQEDNYYGDGLNLYAYCRNNPVRYIDPSGRGTESTSTKNVDPNTAKNAQDLLDLIDELNNTSGATADDIATLKSLAEEYGLDPESLDIKTVDEVNGEALRELAPQASPDETGIIQDWAEEYHVDPDSLEIGSGNGTSGESGSSSELKVIGTYDNNNYFTRAVEFNAGSDGTGFTYKVFQRNDIDWNMVRTTGAKKGRGLTNAQAAEKYGLAPILSDGYVATLHHSQQRSVGPLFEASTRYHNISNAKKGPLHPYKGQLNPFNPMDNTTRGLFQKVDSIEYWKARGRDAMKGVQ